MFGFLNVYKPKGMTSHDVVSVLRRITKIKQIGHTGTLDPFAEGVLPICIGKATRLIEYLNDEKAYIGTVQLGKSTTTYDTEGEGVNFSDKMVSFEDIEEALECFRGEIEQIPPIYSAIKVNGKKLYEYAREGQEVEIKPRKVTINRIDILSFDENKNQVELFIDCSKGTYIRSIAHDLGEKLGTYGHLIKLERVKAGSFMVRKAVKLDDIKTIEDVEKNLISPIEYLNYPKYELNEIEKEKISHGNPIQIQSDNGLVVLTFNSQLQAIAEVKSTIAKVLKVFC
ncbi:MAG: tRNA pseudouridine(55) synthase TruB [bacterium]|nr:tRNA pseudouridine(55) synthase TruB [bacterium]